MNKVTVIVETDAEGQFTRVTRSGELGVDMLLAQCISRVADTFNNGRLDDLAKAAGEAARRR